MAILTCMDLRGPLTVRSGRNDCNLNPNLRLTMADHNVHATWPLLNKALLNMDVGLGPSNLEPTSKLSDEAIMPPILVATPASSDWVVAVLVWQACA